MTTYKDQILSSALAVLEDTPSGMQFSNLARELSLRSPSLNPETIRHYIWDLDRRFPERVWKPSRGRFQLLKYGRDARTDVRASPPPSADSSAQRDSGVRQNAKTFISDHDGVPVAVVVPIEEYNDLVAGALGGGSSAPPNTGEPRRLAPHPHGVSDAEALAEHIRSLANFVFVSPAPPYQHMGATIIDSILQRGMNYEAVVLPRVHRLREEHPEAATTSGFAELMNKVDLVDLIDFRGDYALSTIRELTGVLLDASLETEDALRVWLEQAENRQRLMRINGIGPKTSEFIRLRCGASDAVAVDRWLIRMLEDAGVGLEDFWAQHKVIIEAALLLSVTPADLEESIWTFMSGR